jgi:hypothetical protein
MVEEQYWFKDKLEIVLFDNPSILLDVLKQYLSVEIETDNDWGSSGLSVNVIYNGEKICSSYVALKYDSDY